MTLGMLTPRQADMLAEAGLDYYNHNIDSSPEYLRARHHHPHDGRAAGHAGQRPRLWHQRVRRRDRRDGGDACRPGGLHPHASHPAGSIPESVPVNALVPVKGTVLGDMLADTPLAKIDDIEFVRTVAAGADLYAA